MTKELKPQNTHIYIYNNNYIYIYIKYINKPTGIRQTLTPPGGVLYSKYAGYNADNNTMCVYVCDCECVCVYRATARCISAGSFMQRAVAWQLDLQDKLLLRVSACIYIFRPVRVCNCVCVCVPRERISMWRLMPSRSGLIQRRAKVWSGHACARF